MSKRKSEKSFPYKNKDGKLQLNTNNDIVWMIWEMGYLNFQ